jgi:hypothetical protein
MVDFLPSARAMALPLLRTLYRNWLIAAWPVMGATGTATLNARAMPTALRVGPYRFFFYSSDGGERRHVHVQRDDALAKLWLDPVRVEHSVGFSATEIRIVRSIIAEYRRTLVGRWNEYFGQ